MKKVDAFLFTDILRPLLVAARYVAGRGAGRKIKAAEAAASRPPVVDAGKCTGCKLCMKICPSRAVEVKTPTAGEGLPVEFKLSVERCVSCGLCVESCPRTALAFKKEKANVCG